jgi:MFS family permease
MLSSYRRVLGHPGAALFSATGVVGRMPIAMMTLAIVLLVTAGSGGYALAGQISAAFVVANAAAAIPHGRLLDRLGQSRVLPVDSVLFALGCGLLGYGVLHDWATPWPHVAAALAGLAMPPIGSSVRARWTHLLPDGADKQTAFAVEAVADETVFMTGPTLVTFLATLVAPVAGLVAAVVLGTAGTLALVAQRGTEPPAHPRSKDPAERPPMPWGRLAPLTLVGVSLGALFGATEVATVAFADGLGHKAVSGVLLALWALGSLVSGFVTGAVPWRISTVQRLRRGALFLTLAMAPTPFLPGLWSMGAVLLVAGFAISPTLIAAVSRLEEVAPRSRLSEAMGLLQSGLGAGIAPGAAFGGWVVDHHGGSAAYWVGVGSVAVAVVTAFLARDDGLTSSHDRPHDTGDTGDTGGSGCPGDTGGSGRPGDTDDVDELERAGDG